MTELSQQAITTILGVNVLKVPENVFEHNDGPVFGRSNGKQDGYENCTALTVWDGLIAVQGTDLLCEGKKVGTVSQGEKQFAVVNTRLVIWPDKLSLDLKTLALSAMEAQLECSGGTFETGALTLKRSVPDMDFICESENRLCGCSSRAQTIYASALGDVNNFNVFQGVSTDSFAVAVGSQGDFTGCCRLGSSVLFFKQDTLHKMLGSYPAEYCMYSYVLEGVRAGCHKTMQVINEVLFYMGAHGLYAYSGGSPSLISAGFGALENVQGAAGSDGERYYLSCADAAGDWRLLVYDTRAGLWVQEDRLHCVDFARAGALKTCRRRYPPA